MFPSSSRKFDQFPDNRYPAYGIFRTASTSDCKICVLSSSQSWCSVSSSDNDFLEKFYLLCDPISYLSVCHNEFRQNMCCS